MPDFNLMPDFNDAIQEMPQSFRREKQELDQAGIDRWSTVRSLTDLELSQLARSGQASARNLKRLRGMAELVCVLHLPPQDAALLMHAGIATPAALAACSPELQAASAAGVAMPACISSAASWGGRFNTQTNSAIPRSRLRLRADA